MAFVTYKELLERYRTDPRPRSRISRDLKEGRLARLCPGWCEEGDELPSPLFANLLVQPSYVSFAYTLFLYQLIPEGVFCISSACVGSRHRCLNFDTEIGRFLYLNVPEKAFYCGLEMDLEVGKKQYLMATREKALCDFVCMETPIYSINDMESFLFENLRIDDLAFFNLDLRFISHVAPLYGNANGYYLQKYVARHIAATYLLPEEEKAWYDSVSIEQEPDWEDIRAENEVRERLQRIVLEALSKAGFFTHASLYGSGALRLVHGMKRHAFDLDFELLAREDNFRLEPWLEAIGQAFASLGIIVRTTPEERKKTLASASLVMKKRTLYKFFGADAKVSPKLLARTHWNRDFRLGIDVETRPFENLRTVDASLLGEPHFTIRLHDLPTLFAGKLTALHWKSNNGLPPTGRHLHDYLFLLDRNISPNKSYLLDSCFTKRDFDTRLDNLRETYIMLQYVRFKIYLYEIEMREVRFLLENNEEVVGWEENYFHVSLKKLDKLDF